MKKQIGGAGFVDQLRMGFIAGFLATLLFHQLTVAFLRGVHVVSVLPFSMTPTEPFGIPFVLSLAFWGGIWGIVLLFVQRKFPGGPAYWATSFLFGAIFPSFAALAIVLPLKGHPMGGGWPLPLVAAALMSNGAWGVGTALFLRTLGRRRRALRIVDASSPHGGSAGARNLKVLR